VNEFSAPPPASDQELKELLMSAPRRPRTAPAPRFCRPYSQMVKAARGRDLRLFLYQARQLGLSLLGGSR